MVEFINEKFNFPFYRFVNVNVCSTSFTIHFECTTFAALRFDAILCGAAPQRRATVTVV